MDEANAKEIYYSDIYNEFIVFGGYKHEIIVKDYVKDIVIMKVEDLDNSVFWCKFIDESTIIFILVDGIIGMIRDVFSPENSTVVLEERVYGDVSEVKFSRDRIYVGFESGIFIVFDLSLSILFEVPVCNSYIKDFDYCDDKFMIISEKNLVEFNIYSSNLLSLRINNGVVVKYLGGSAFSLASREKIEFFKNTQIVFRYPISDSEFIETAAVFNTYLVFGGYFPYIGFIDLKNYQIYKHSIECSAIKIYVVDEDTLVFYSDTSTVGLIKIINKRLSIEYFETPHTNIFHLHMPNYSVISVCGDQGCFLVNTEDHCFVEISE